jgi:hypothetical protein
MVHNIRSTASVKQISFYCHTSEDGLKGRKNVIIKYILLNLSHWIACNSSNSENYYMVLRYSVSLVIPGLDT